MVTTKTRCDATFTLSFGSTEIKCTQAERGHTVAYTHTHTHTAVVVSANVYAERDSVTGYR